MGENDNAEQLPASQPPLCSNGCGFFGNPATRGLCSKCYKQQLALEEDSRQAAHPPASQPSQPHEHQPSQTQHEHEYQHDATDGSFPSHTHVQQQQQQQVELNLNSSDTDAENAEAQHDQSGTASASCSVEEQQPPQKDRTRCFVCSKKVGLTGFTCRCKYVFCGTHRYADKHDCQIDYKSLGREEVAKHNPAVVASKVDKI